jgi:hypothetical protein
MPVYQYEDGQGKIVELVRSVATRDCVPRGLKRIVVPLRIAIAGTSSSPLDPETADAQVPDGLKALSNRQVHAMVKESGMSVDRFKRTWGL